MHQPKNTPPPPPARSARLPGLLVLAGMLCILVGMQLEEAVILVAGAAFFVAAGMVDRVESA